MSRLTKLTDDLLNLQQLEEGRITLNLEHFEVCDLVADVQNEFTPMLIDKGQSIKVSCDDVFVRMDRLRIMQVLINLLSNASKFSPKGARALKWYLDAEKCMRFWTDLGEDCSKA